MSDGSDYFVYRQLDIARQMDWEDSPGESMSERIQTQSQLSLITKGQGQRGGKIPLEDESAMEFQLPTPMRREDDPYLGMEDPDVAGRRAGILGREEIFSVTGQVYEALARGVLLLGANNLIVSNPAYDPRRDPDSPLFSRQLYRELGPLMLKELTSEQHALAAAVFEFMPMPFSAASTLTTLEPSIHDPSGSLRRRKTDFS